MWLVAAMTFAVGAAGPASAATTKIMPLGDSLTDGLTSPGAYRTQLYSLLAGGGFSFDFVGSLQSGPDSLPDKDHEGHRGFTIDQLAAGVPGWMSASQPDIVLLMIGTNDMLQNLDPANAPARLESLISTIAAARPSAPILLASIPPLADSASNDRVNAYNAALPGVVDTEISQGKHVTLVDIHDSVSTSDLADGVHFTAAGYAKMATPWYNALLGALPSSATLSASPSTVAPGGSVTGAWSAIRTPTPQDWVGLFPAGAPDNGYVVWHYTNGAASGSLSLTVPAGQASGTYELRLYTNNGFQRLATSNAITVGTGGGGGGGGTTGGSVTLSASPTSVAPGSPVTGTWGGIPSPTAQDWVGLYAAGAPDSGYIVWHYTNGAASGSLALTIPAGSPAGNYELRLYTNNTFTRLATSNAVTVGSGGGGGGTTGSATLSASPGSVAPGNPVTGTWSGIATPTPQDWVGLFAAGAPDSSYIVWHYTNGAASGSLSLTVPVSQAAGTYELRLFTNNTFQRLATSGAFTVPGGSTSTSLTVSPTNATGGTVLTATWSGDPSPTPQDWIGLYLGSALDNGYVVWHYTNGAASGSLTLTVPSGTPAGGYQLRMFANNSFQRLAVSNPVFLS